MIAEILSDSTAKYVRDDKFRMYCTIPSFKEYLLMTQTAMQLKNLLLVTQFLGGAIAI